MTKTCLKILMRIGWCLKILKGNYVVWVSKEYVRVLNRHWRRKRRGNEDKKWWKQELQDNNPYLLSKDNRTSTQPRSFQMYLNKTSLIKTNNNVKNGMIICHLINQKLLILISPYSNHNCWPLTHKKNGIDSMICFWRLRLKGST
jgi:hypothetical protein